MSDFILSIHFDSGSFGLICYIISAFSWIIACCALFWGLKGGVGEIIIRGFCSLIVAALPILWFLSRESETESDRRDAIELHLIPLVIFLIFLLYNWWSRSLSIKIFSPVIKGSGVRRWNFQLTSPVDFPICPYLCQVKSVVDGAFVRFAIEMVEKTSSEIVNCKHVGEGIGDKMGCMCRYEGWGFPKGVNLIWTSEIERKKYVANFLFNEEEFGIIKRQLEEEYEGEGKSNPQLYSDFAVCCLPGGQLRFFLYGKCRQVCFDFYRQAEASELTEEEGMMHTRDVPYGLWNNYFRRYNYTIKAVLREENGRSIYSDYAYFTNGEFFLRNIHETPSNVISKPSVVRKYSFRWAEPKANYEYDVLFNEENIFAVFDKAFREHPYEEAVLQVVVEKDRRPTASLNIGFDSYELSSLEFNLWKFCCRDTRQSLVRSNYLKTVYRCDGREVADCGKYWQGRPKNIFKGA